MTACYAPYKVVMYRPPRMNWRNLVSFSAMPLVASPPIETYDKTLYCHLLEGHEGNHRTTVPLEAGEDGGKLLEFPRT